MKELTYSALLGAAGTGKSHTLRERAADNPNYAKVTATTGIAAVNLGAGVTTLNSTLGFFNEESAQDALNDGKMMRAFVKLADQGYENLVIDEVSMLPAKTLDIVCTAASRAAAHIQSARPDIDPVSIILTGDFCQLPPVRGAFGFKAESWQAFEPNITHLRTNYRQSDPVFLEALNAARGGKGTTAALKLREAGVIFSDTRNDYFEGLTLMPTNKSVDTLNNQRFAEINATPKLYQSKRWGDPSGEWKDIPETLEMKELATVTVLANEPQTFEYVNGDMGVVVEMDDNYVAVEIRRGQQRTVKYIPFIFRETVQRVKPEAVAEFSGFLCGGSLFKSPREIEQTYKDAVEAAESSVIDAEYVLDVLASNKRRHMAQFFEQYDRYVSDAIKLRQPYYSVDKSKWVVGWCEYMPIRLGYAATIHKSQGLTLDSVQIDARMSWRKPSGEMCGAGSPGSMYVALSRCRTAQNIRVVCDIASFGKRVQTATECLRWV